MKKLILLSLSSIFIATTASAHTLCGGFAPKNDRHYPINNKSVGFEQYQSTTKSPMAAGGISEEDFKKSTDKVMAAFAKEIREAGGVVKLNMMWTNDMANASTDRQGSTWIFNMYGGLARHPKMTVDAFTAVVCHELGHQLGGAPKNSGAWMRTGWATNEGQADYFATTKCLRRVLAVSETEELLRTESVDDYAKTQCAKAWSNPVEADLCQRYSMAGKALAEVLQDLSSSPQVNFMTPDTREVSKTYNGHPQAQCRMDTYFQGALCTVSQDSFSDNMYLQPGSCTEMTHEMGNRPRCWLKASWHH